MGRRLLRRHIWGYSVCLCPIKGTPGLNELKRPFCVHLFIFIPVCYRSLLQASLPYYNSSRTAVRFSLSRGQPKTVKAVPLRFFRLRSGIWIRTWPGRKKRLWKRNEETRLRFKYHIFCNKTQSRMLDKMVTNYWKRPRFYPDDPYEPYHRRHGLDHHGQYAEQKIPGVPKWYP